MQRTVDGYSIGSTGLGRSAGYTGRLNTDGRPETQKSPGSTGAVSGCYSFPSPIYLIRKIITASSDDSFIACLMASSKARCDLSFNLRYWLHLGGCFTSLRGIICFSVCYAIIKIIINRAQIRAPAISSTLMMICPDTQQ